MPGPSIAPTDRGTFLDAVRAAGLLTAAQQARALVLAPHGPAADAAGALVAAGLLTRFQADRLLAGRTDGFFLGPYLILEQVGRGAMSRVYKAKHRTMNRTVAVKMLSADLTRTPAEREALQTAVRAAGKLAHPNIVTAYDANERHDRFYLVLEFVDGPNFDALVHQRGPLPVGEACEFVRQTAAGLQHAHEKGIIHRDIKPTNLLVARPTPAAPLVVKIADFGLPKGRPTGPFAAPEARGAEMIDRRSDLYSLGCVFYFLLTGREPDLLPVPLAQFRPDVPPDVAAIVYRLLAPHVDARFQSAEELLAHLNGVCVPVALPAGAVDFDIPLPPLYPAQDSGYLTGRHAQASSATIALPPAPAELSPWAQLAVEATEDTYPLGREDTPPPIPTRSKPPGKGEPVPLWITLALLVSIVLLCLMGIGVVIKLLAK
jgi:eukaryotic-like serine/threonine-protein kinase